MASRVLSGFARRTAARRLIPPSSRPEAIGNRSVGLPSAKESALGSLANSSNDNTDKPNKESRKDISTIEDPFDAPTYNIPEKPVTFTEGASYSLVILAGLGVAGVAAYAVFKELIFEPKELTAIVGTINLGSIPSETQSIDARPFSYCGSLPPDLCFAMGEDEMLDSL
ncbi:hypothetical protein ZIOFF_010553 [Zingiber officinale]|uniref:Mitochondrial import inner membrane translocase subunit Tim21 n=1 Tax=Zingiber officinale TaxID=94328 RepID=A0A8J5I0J5_ZINOF|nr:hypothetical protein ZIOFF_010553 [Zingiber officinale]